MSVSKSCAVTSELPSPWGTRAVRALAGVCAVVALLAASAAQADACDDSYDIVMDGLKAGTLSETAPDLFASVEAACAEDPTDHAFTYMRLALDLSYRKHHEAADRAAMRQIELQQAAGRGGDWRTAARVSAARGLWREADERYGKAFQFYADRPEVMTADRAYLLEEWSGVHERLGDMDRAATVMREAVAVMSVNSGDRHAAVGQMIGKLASLEARRGDKARAVDLYREAIAIYDVTRQDYRTAELRQNLSTALFGLGRLDEAEAEAREAVARTEKTSPAYGSRIQTLASAMIAQGRGREAQAMLEAEGYEYPKSFDAPVQELTLLAQMAVAGGNPAMASIFYDQALERMEAQPGEASRVTILYNAALMDLISGFNYSALEGFRQASQEAAMGSSPPQLRLDIERRRVWALWVEAGYTPLQTPDSKTPE